MLSTRVIPVLLLHKQGLVKTVKFKKPKYVGDPLNSIKIFNEKEVDELIFLDIDKSKNNKEPDYELITSFASECFMPICYGGGITTIEQMKKIFKIGVEKIALNSSALENESLLREAVSIFGAQSIVVAIDIKKNLLGKYKIYSHNKKKVLKNDIDEYIQLLNNIGVGEIFINNVDLDGAQTGYNIELLKMITKKTDIPVIACGGAGSLEDFKIAKQEAGVSAVAAGSLFVFKGKHKAVLITYPKYNELEKLFNEEVK
jgi:cyclase